ncbi:cupin domain-containing protein [Mycobacterium sp. KBS0706]|uniref:cupin domain-containing protein n=1 Tax=Mycobacterium sp. KBS0706 TaxID=2578109 RepID=UPI00110FC97E|nr:cupin domain-containing protein [Mycobacterium sp. KBS0706]TSD88318.1 cupin domain-containing protein [Mycobacterium sp. KBS0706]
MSALHPGPQPMRLVLLVAGGAAALAALWGIRPADVPATAPAMPAHLHAQAEPGAVPGARPATVVKPLSCEALPNVPGKSITTVTVDFPPGAYTPAHRHPGSVTAFVIRGAVRSQLAGSPPQLYGPGATWFEPPGALHLFAENASAAEPAQILAVFVADDNCGPLVIPEQ